MKKTLLAVATVALASNAMASQIRMDTLGNARTVRQDFVDMFVQPSVMWSGEVTDQVLMENGTGGFLMSSGDDAKYGIYFGRQSSIANLYSLAGAPFNAAPFSNAINNPLHFFYGRDMGGMKWGFNLYYAASKQEVPAGYEQAYSGVALGVDGGSWRADLALGLGSKVEDTTNSNNIKGDSNMRFQVEYDVASGLRAYVDVTQAGVTGTVGSTEKKVKYEKTALGIERKMSKDAANFFYGARLENGVTDVAGTKTETQSLPIYFGVETDATSWLVLRGLVSQPVLLGATKVPGGTNSMTSGLTYRAGAGLRLGNFLVDGSIGLGSGTSNTLDSSNLMTKTAITYNF
jgi:hypothetical protein